MHGWGVLSLLCLVSLPNLCGCCLSLPTTACCSQGQDGRWQAEVAEIMVRSAFKVVFPHNAVTLTS